MEVSRYIIVIRFAYLCNDASKLVLRGSLGQKRSHLTIHYAYKSGVNVEQYNSPVAQTMDAQVSVTTCCHMPC